ncbi:unnamed protein product [Porites evermanni]|uniref:Uncharacterized protein n=2 Tax=Porites evermanni TaxID=104178 RepID=A0ABN8QC11_9CNID|nr:unnamed protein product [Porites evermanni]
MNQLQSLLHDSLIATGHIQHCAIIRRKDTSLRASTVGFSPSLDNIHALVHCFTNSSLARREGLKFQDTVYECVRADRFSVYAKKAKIKIAVKTIPKIIPPINEAPSNFLPPEDGAAVVEPIVLEAFEGVKGVLIGVVDDVAVGDAVVGAILLVVLVSAVAGDVMIAGTMVL